MEILLFKENKSCQICARADTLVLVYHVLSHLNQLHIHIRKFLSRTAMFFIINNVQSICNINGLEEYNLSRSQYCTF